MEHKPLLYGRRFGLEVLLQQDWMFVNNIMERVGLKLIDLNAAKKACTGTGTTTAGLWQLGDGTRRLNQAEVTEEYNGTCLGRSY